jgi:hypothetical protein
MKTNQVIGDIAELVGNFRNMGINFSLLKVNLFEHFFCFVYNFQWRLFATAVQ